MPTEPSAPLVSPSVMPTVSHESYAAVATTEKNDGLTPPTLAPNGAASWYARGMDMVTDADPKME